MDELKVIEQALNVANAKGCFNLEESYNIKHCLEVVKQMPKQLELAQTEVKKLSEDNDKLNMRVDYLSEHIQSEKSNIPKEQAPPPKLKSHK